MIGQRIVYGVDLGIGQHLFVRAVCFGNSEQARCRFGVGQAAGSDGGDLAELSQLHGRNHLRGGNARDAQYTPSDFLHSPRILTEAPLDSVAAPCFADIVSLYIGITCCVSWWD